MLEKPRVVLATRNRHKLREITTMLDGASFRIAGLDEFPDVVLPPEDGHTFEENAIGKAEALARQTGLIAIGDDSGLEVDALEGAPGIYSARFSGAGSTDASNLLFLLQKLVCVPDEKRTARFVCVLAIACPGEPTRTARGTCEGRISHAPSGTEGFGYDPVFIIPEDGRTLAELSAEEKNRISHRSRALTEGRKIIEDIIGGLDTA